MKRKTDLLLSYHKERGMVAIMWLAALPMMLLFAGLIIDSYFIYKQSRDLQSAVNSIATQLANESKSCHFPGEQGSVFTGGDLSATARYLLKEIYKFDDAIVQIAKPVLVETIGVGKEARHSVFDNVGAESTNGVSLKVAKPLQNTFFMHAFIGKDKTKGHVVASATVKKEVFATFWVDGGLLALDTSKSVLLGPILKGLGSNLSLDGVNFSSLAGLVGNLDDLLHGVTKYVPGVSDLLELDLTGEMIRSLLDGVSAGVTPTTKLIDELLELINGDTNNTLKLGDIINIVGTEEIPKGAKLPILGVVESLVMNLAQPLSGELKLDLGGLSSFSDDPGAAGLFELPAVTLWIDGPPKIVIAPARKGADGNWVGKAKGADIRLDLDLLSLGANDVFEPVAAEVGLRLSLGSTEATLVDTSCARGNDNQVNFAFEVKKQTIQLSSLKADENDYRILSLRLFHDPNASTGKIKLPWVLEQTCRPPNEFVAGGSQTIWGVCDYTSEFLGIKWPSVRKQDCNTSSRGLPGIRNGVFTAHDNQNVWGSCTYDFKCDSLLKVEVEINPEGRGYFAPLNPPTPEFIMVKNNSLSKVLQPEKPKVHAGSTGSATALNQSLDELLKSIKLTTDVACLPLGGILNPVVDVVVVPLLAVLKPVVSGVVGPLLENVLGVDLGSYKVGVVASEQNHITLIENCVPGFCEG